MTNLCDWFSGVPCLCLSVWNTFIIGGYANGQLRVYDSESGIRVVEVAAHARPVMAIDVASSAGIVSKVYNWYNDLNPNGLAILFFRCCLHLRIALCVYGPCPSSRIQR